MDSSTGLWIILETNPFKVPSVVEGIYEKGPHIVGVRKEEWANFYKSDNYVKDNTTNRMTAAVTKETCKANDGFVCKVGGEETCFKKINRCDLYAQCDPREGSDVAEDELDCDEQYKKKGLVPKKANFRCQSLHHNEDSVKANLSRGVVYIRAVLQDNNTECWNEEDEKERPTKWVSFYFPAIFLTVLSIATICASTILQTCYRRGKDISSLSGGNSTLKTLVDGSTTEVKEVIDDRRISSCLAQLQKLDLPREKRRRINRKFVICLAAGQAKAFAKLKKLAKQKTAQQVIEDFTHPATSCKGQLKDNIEDLKDSVEKKYNAMSCTCSTGNGCCGRCSYQRQCCKPGPQPTTDGLGSKLFRLVKTIAKYVDLVRDTVLVGLLITLTAFFSSDITLDFHNVVILILR